jgi:hypothetical protein
MHVASNGTVIEEFNLGVSNISKELSSQMIETIIEDDLSAYEMMLDPQIPYL